MLYALSALFVVHVVVGQNVDLTVSPGAKGKDVVESVVERIRSKCIFANDRLFLRRLAYVESQDGMDSKTYRKGFHGGIWQVDEEKFNATQSCPFFVAEECSIIRSEFNITWQKTTREDLRKPLYSGLAAALYMIIRLGFLHKMPGDLAGQADVWSHFYHLNNPVSDFIEAGNLVKEDCKGRLDLTFVMDSSGSIYPTDYTHMLSFIQNVTRELEFGPDATQFAAVNYGTGVEVSFYFDSFTSKEAIINAIALIQKDDGGTRTYDGLNYATDRVFQSKRGAREGVPRVIILLTDGASSNFNKTVAAAEKAKQSGITIFSVGIGAINRLELEAVATDPNCTHLFILEGFSEIDGLLNELRKSSCKAPTVITGPGTGGNSTNNGTGIGHVTGTLKNTTQSTTIKIDSNWIIGGGGDEIIMTEVICGVLDIYASYDTPNPGPAFFDQTFRVTDGHPAIMSLVKLQHGRPLYITVIGTKLPSNPDNIDKCADAKYTISIGKKSAIEIFCKEHGEYRQCTREDYIRAEIRPIICDENQWGLLTNPCTQDNLEKGILIHPHPYNSNLFIKCDFTGRMYVTMCPNNEIFNKDMRSCGFETVSIPIGGIALPSYIPSPCTPQTIQDGEFFFPYPNDVHKFIHCDVWGGAWVQPCRPNHIWNDIARTCVEDFFHEFDPSTSQPVTIHNPCVVGSNIFYYPHPDITKYIHCDVAGNYWIQSCQPSFYFDPESHVCVPHGMMGG